MRTTLNEQRRQQGHGSRSRSLAEELKEAYRRNLRELVREVRIPGSGRAKRRWTMVEQQLGDEAILHQTLDRP